MAEAQGDVNVNLARMASPGYSNTIIGPGDVLEVAIVSGRENEQVKPLSVRVADDGSADIPLIGSVRVGGLDPLAASHNVAALGVERGIYRQPHVTIDIKTKATYRVTVMGAVEDPGVHELPRGSSDLLSAIAMAGGLSDDAGTEVEILRQNPTSGDTRFAAAPTAAAEGEVQLAAYSELTQRPGAAGTATVPGPKPMRIDLASANSPRRREDYRLQERDVVMVLPRTNQKIHVSGLVRNPGQYELPKTEDLHLLDAIAMAGGESSIIADKVLVIRRIEGREEPVVIQASLRKCKRNGKENLRLGPGDMVSVENTPTTAVFDTFTKLIRMSIGITGRTATF